MGSIAFKLPEDQVQKRIESCCLRFLESLVIAEQSSPGIAALESESVDADYSIRLTTSNVCGFTFVARTLSQVYSLLLSKSSATKRDLFYEQKDLYGEQRNFDRSITKVCKLLGVDRTSNNVIASGRGLIMGELKIYNNGSVLDCSAAPVTVNHLPSHAVLDCDARFVLVVEKDATFQKLVQEDFFSLFVPALLVTAKGYPDLATRRLLKLLSDDFKMPVFGLMDSDPHGIEIAMTYKYGTMRRNIEMGDLCLPKFEWIGYPVPADQFLRMNGREKRKTSLLCRRASTLKDWNFLRELNCLLDTGFKLEMEAISGIAPGYLGGKFLFQKLSAFTRQQNSGNF